MTCNHIDLYKIIIFTLHHLLNTFVFFGFLINETRRDYIIHLLIIISILVHWLTNNYDCVLTIHLNKLCGFNKKLWFQSVVYKIYELTDIYYIHTYWIIGLIIFDIFKIYY